MFSRWTVDVLNLKQKSVCKWDHTANTDNFMSKMVTKTKDRSKNDSKYITTRTISCIVLIYFLLYPYSYTCFIWLYDPINSNENFQSSLACFTIYKQKHAHTAKLKEQKNWWILHKSDIKWKFIIYYHQL